MRVLLLLTWFCFLLPKASATERSVDEESQRLQEQIQVLKALGFPTTGFESLDRCALELISAHQEKMIRDNREMQIWLVEQQISQLQNLISDWQYIPKGQAVCLNQTNFGAFSKYLQGLQSGLVRLARTLANIQLIAHKAATSVEVSAEAKKRSTEDQLLVHDLLNVLSVASYSSQFLELSVSAQDGARALSSDTINLLHQELVRLELVLLRVSILAHSFTEALPQKVVSTVSIATIVEELSILFAGAVNTNALTAVDRQIALLVDHDGLVRSVANLRKNSLEARPNDAALDAQPIQISLRIESPGYSSGLFLNPQDQLGVKTIVFLDPPLPERYFVVEVQDNAGGIPLDHLNRTFEKGFSGHEASVRGLGLFSVAREMERMDGCIRLSTSPTGTRVELGFPIGSYPEP